MIRAILISSLFVLCVCPLLAQVAPPEYLNYQGVLRDAAGVPLDGSYDMVFRFYDDQSAGSVLLIDRHTSVDPPPASPVQVSGGVFDVHLGAGAITPGIYGSVGEMCAGESALWTEIEVGGETLSPRVRVVSAAYAMNAAHFGGRAPAAFLDTSATEQTKLGRLTIQSGASPGLTVTGGQHANAVIGTDSDTAAAARLQVIVRDNVDGGLKVVNADTDGPIAYFGSDPAASTANNWQGWRMLVHADGDVGVQGDLQVGGVVQSTGSFVGDGSGLTGVIATTADDADTVDGSHASEFVNTSAAPQTKSGPLTMDGTVTITRTTGSALVANATIRGVGLTDDPIPQAGLILMEDRHHEGEDDWYQYVGSAATDLNVVGDAVGIKLGFAYNHPAEKTVGFAAMAEDNWANLVGLGLFTQGTEQVRIDSNGRVGIGETDPTAKLHVAGTIRGTGDATVDGALDVGGTISGDGTGLSNLDAGQLATGVVPDAVISGTYTQNLSFSSPNNVYSGDGSQLTGIALAANADQLDGLDSSDFLNRSSTPQTKNGPLTLANSTAQSRALTVAGGTWGNALLGDLTDTASAARLTVRVQDGNDGALKVVNADTAGTIAYFGALDGATGPSWPGSAMIVRQNQVHIAGQASVQSLEIRGGSDLAEPFDVRSGDRVEPGAVVAIDPDRPGGLRIARSAYDPTVVGVISGANGLRPGIVMSQHGTVASGDFPVALAGRVWCLTDADAEGPIEPGDLLTTSDTPGHAMRAANHARSRGTVLGKAMTGLDHGRGLVLVLVSLN